MSHGYLDGVPQREVSDLREAGAGDRMQRILPGKSCQLLPPFRPQYKSLPTVSLRLPLSKPLPPPPAQFGGWGMTATSCSHP